MTSPLQNPGRKMHNQRGVTLVELMVALVLGLVVSGAALALFMTNKQVYTASENLDRVQESSRTAFELMARDLREANGIPCTNDLGIYFINYLKNPANYWWGNWGYDSTSTSTDLGDGLLGYSGTDAFPDAAFGTGEGDRVAGTPAIEVWGAVSTDIMVTNVMGAPADPLTVTTTTGKIASNDILVICDYSNGAIFQATKVTANSIEHGSSGTPGNATANLSPVYGPDSLKPDKFAYISKLHASRWYVGYNGRTDRDGNKLTSLYRTAFTGSTLDPTPDEIVEGAVGLTIKYHVQNTPDYVDPPVDWANVDAVQIGLTLASRDKVGTDKQTLKRDYDHVVTIRSRAP